MRIASLVPSATEILFALGLGDQVVAVTHECDYPPEATDLPRLTSSVLTTSNSGETAAPIEIDRQVRAQTDEGRSLYSLDTELLMEEEPDLIVAQQLCDVCAVSFEDVRAVAERIPSKPKVISLDPTTLGEAVGDIRTVSEAADCRDAGVELLRELADRIDDVKIALRNVGRDGGPPRKRVAALEWLDPPFVGGHWVPQMIELAGGIDLLGMPGERSREADWDEIRASDPEVVVLMQCGYSKSGAAREAEDFSEHLTAVNAGEIYACDASAYFSRPGPRLVDGLELLAHTLFPTLIEEPAADRMLRVEL